MKHLKKHYMMLVVLLMSLGFLGGCSEIDQVIQVVSDEVTSSKSEPAVNQSISGTSELAYLEYQGVQTIEINGNQPNFTEADLSLDQGAWDYYGDLDYLNRVTVAEAMLNQSLMPTGKRESISSVKPTGWKNKQIKNGYLYNRCHLIGWALAGENANWKNLMTGTRQLNSPEMLRYEMDVKAYLDASPSHYVRYRVTPIFREDELLARGVQMEAQSIQDDAIQFNVYIFNVQDGVTLDYSDGSSAVDSSQAPDQTSHNKSNHAVEKVSSADLADDAIVFTTQKSNKYHKEPHGSGQFIEIKFKDAKTQGLEPCKTCFY